MSRATAAGAARRLKAAATRLENQPYDPGAAYRPPRLGGPSGHGWCQLASSLGPATGTWPSLTPTSVTGVTIYREQGGSLVALSGTFKLYNWRSVTWSAGKTTFVVPNGDNTWDIVDQDC